LACDFELGETLTLAAVPQARSLAPLDQAAEHIFGYVEEDESAEMEAEGEATVKLLLQVLLPASFAVFGGLLAVLVASLIVQGLQGLLGVTVVLVDHDDELAEGQQSHSLGDATREHTRESGLCPLEVQVLGALADSDVHVAKVVRAADHLVCQEGALVRLKAVSGKVIVLVG